MKISRRKYDYINARSAKLGEEVADLQKQIEKKEKELETLRLALEERESYLSLYKEDLKPELERFRRENHL